jgi:hypothetical protein
MFQTNAKLKELGAKGLANKTKEASLICSTSQNAS